MQKNQILKGLDEVKETLSDVKEKLDNLVSEPIWPNEVYPELDSSVGILQEINIKINEIIDIQERILKKPK